MKTNLLFALLLSAFVGLTAQTPITLSEAIEIGLANNYQIQIAERQVDIAQNNNTLKATGRYPRVDFNTSFNNRFSSSNNPASFIQGVNNNISSGLTPSVDARWTVFDGFKFKINKARLEQLERQSQGQVGIAVENTIRGIMLAYYQAIIQKEQLEVLEEVLNLSRDRISYQKVRQEFGQAGSFDLLQAEDAYLNDSTTLLIQQNGYDAALLNLALTMGIDDPDIRHTPSDTLAYATTPYEYEELEQRLFSDNNNLKQLAIAKELAAVNTRFQESNKYPTISLGSGVSFAENAYWQNGNNPITQEAFGGSFNNNFNYYANLSLTYPLYDAGARKRALENAKVEEMITDLNIQDLRRSLAAQLRNTLTNYDNQLRLLALTEARIATAQQNLLVAEERFKGSLISSFDYRSVQLAYINASQARLNALFNLKNTETELIRITGGLVR
jgi:outer membrane protein TolC